MKDLELRRLTARNTQLTKAVVREQCVKEGLKTHVNGYSNPAKLMNYIKMRKAIENTNFNNVKEYVSHVEAFSKLTNKQTAEERERQRHLLKQIEAKKSMSGT